MKPWFDFGEELRCSVALLGPQWQLSEAQCRVLRTFLWSGAFCADSFPGHGASDRLEARNEKVLGYQLSWAYRVDSKLRPSCPEWSSDGTYYRKEYDWFEITAFILRLERRSDTLKECHFEKTTRAGRRSKRPED